MTRPLRPGDKVRLKMKREDFEAGPTELLIVGDDVVIEAVVKEITAGQAVVLVGETEVHIQLGDEAMRSVAPTRWDS